MGFFSDIAIGVVGGVVNSLFGSKPKTATAPTGSQTAKGGATSLLRSSVKQPPSAPHRSEADRGSRSPTIPAFTGTGGRQQIANATSALKSATPESYFWKTIYDDAANRAKIKK